MKIFIKGLFLIIFVMKLGAMGQEVKKIGKKENGLIQTKTLLDLKNNYNKIKIILNEVNYKYIPDHEKNEFIFKVIEYTDNSLQISLTLPAYTSFELQNEELINRFSKLEYNAIEEMINCRIINVSEDQLYKFSSKYREFQKIIIDFDFLNVLNFPGGTSELSLNLYKSYFIKCKIPEVNPTINKYINTMLVEFEKMQDLEINFPDRENMSEVSETELKKENKILEKLAKLENLDGKSIIKELKKIDEESKRNILPLLLSSIVEEGDINKLDFLKNKGFQISVKSYLNEDLLNVAVLNNNIDFVKYFLKNGLDINNKDNYKNNALINSIKWASEEMSLFLLANGAEYNICNNNHEYPLFLSIVYKQPKVFCKLLEMNADVNKENIFGEIPLITSIKEGDLEMTKKLLEKTKNKYKKDIYGWNAFLHAVNGGNLDLIKIFINEGYNVNTCDNFGYTPLMIATLNEFEDVFKYLKKIGADPELEVKLGQYYGYTIMDLKKILRLNKVHP